MLSSLLWQDFFASIGLKHFPAHSHVFLTSCIGWFVVHYVSHVASPVIFPNTFNRLTSKNRSNWHLQLTSFLHAIIVVPWCLSILGDLKYLDFAEKSVLGYNHDACNLFAFTLGYFVYDVVTLLKNRALFTFAFFAHGIFACMVFLMSFKPFLGIYGVKFLLFEASTPFLHIRWFGYHLGWEKSILYKLNAILFASVFFLVRLVFGYYTAYKLHNDLVTMDWGTDSNYFIFAYFSGALFTCLNTWWFYMVMNALFGREESAKKNASHHDVKNE